MKCIYLLIYTLLMIFVLFFYNSFIYLFIIQFLFFYYFQFCICVRISFCGCFGSCVVCVLSVGMNSWVDKIQEFAGSRHSHFGPPRGEAGQRESEAHQLGSGLSTGFTRECLLSPLTLLHHLFPFIHSLTMPSLRQIKGHL